MCGFRQAGHQWLQSGCLGCRPIQGSSLKNPQHGLPARGLSQNPSGRFRGHQPGQVAGPSGCGWQQRPGLSWMIKLIEKAMLCHRKASYVMSSRKSVQLWQGAPGQRLTVAIMLPGRQIADNWPDFMLSQRTHGPPLLPRRLSQR